MRSATPQEIVFVAGRRTPFGTFGGTLKDLSATDLAVHAAEAALRDSGLPADASATWSSATCCRPPPTPSTWPATSGSASGVPVETPALTVNRLCGSGLRGGGAGRRSRSRPGRPRWCWRAAPSR